MMIDEIEQVKDKFLRFKNHAFREGTEGSHSGDLEFRQKGHRHLCADRIREIAHRHDCRSII